MFLFASDTNISTLGSGFSSTDTDLDYLDNRLSANHLALNLNKTVQPTPGCRTTRILELAGVPMKREHSCNYLDFYIESKLSFQHTIKILCTKRQYVSRDHLISYYKSIIKPVLQNENLVYGYYSYKTFQPNFIIQKLFFESP